MVSSVCRFARYENLTNHIIILSFQVEKYFFIKIHEYVNAKPFLSLFD